MDKQKLLDLQEEINEAREKASELKGQLNYHMKELKERWGCSTVEAAEEKAEGLKQQTEQLQSSIDDGLAELEEKYEFN